MLDRTQMIPEAGTKLAIENVGMGESVQPAIMEVIDVHDHRVVTVAIHLVNPATSPEHLPGT